MLKSRTSKHIWRGKTWTLSLAWTLEVRVLCQPAQVQFCFTLDWEGASNSWKIIGWSTWPLQLQWRSLEIKRKDILIHLLIIGAVALGEKSAGPGSFLKNLQECWINPLYLYGDFYSIIASRLMSNLTDVSLWNTICNLSMIENRVTGCVLVWFG